MFWRVVFTCWSTVEISFFVRTIVARPDISTGVPYVDRILKDAAGFDLLHLAKPQETTEPIALLKADILWRMFGRFPWTDLRTPTCSSWVAKSIVLPSILIGLYGTK